MSRRRDRGSLAVEVAILAPAFIALIVLAVIVGRTVTAANAVDLAAHDAARAASLARNAAAAHEAASTAVTEALAQQGVTCENTPEPDYEGTTFKGEWSDNTLRDAFQEPVGEPASITVTVSCEVSFADLGWPGAPPGRTQTATYESVLDTYRSRS